MSNPIKLPPKPNACELCQRQDIELTRHHLIPRSLHSKAWVRKSFDRETRITATAWLCRACHNHIHAQVSEKQMARYYHSLDRLLELESIRDFCQWLSNKPAGFKPAQKRRKR